MTLDNCNYDKIKLLHELSRMLWFIKNHALEDARSDQKCTNLLKDMQVDIEKHIGILQKMLCK